VGCGVLGRVFCFGGGGFFKVGGVLVCGGWVFGFGGRVFFVGWGGGGGWGCALLPALPAAPGPAPAGQEIAAPPHGIP